MLDHPLTFEPVLVDKPWGGDRLRRFGREVAVGARIGESWDVADLAPGQSSVADPVARVARGAHAGRSLAELIDEHGSALLGAVAPTAAGRFPLLVKLLDARETLSVQVHPPRSLAPDDFKTESWIVLDAEPGSTLLLGVEHGVTREQTAAAMGTADLIGLLREVPVESGDIVHLPAGTIHALGAGVLVAEVQTTSDTTYRVWDWPDDRDGGRELHVEHAREAVAAGWGHNLEVALGPGHDGVLVDAGPYVLERATLSVGAAVGGAPSARVVIVIEGELRWSDPVGAASLTPGGVALFPARVGDAVVAAGPDTTIVVATPA